MRDVTESQPTAAVRLLIASAPALGHELARWGWPLPLTGVVRARKLAQANSRARCQGRIESDYPDLFRQLRACLGGSPSLEG